ncbi:hypothetical protein AB0I35_23020 [Nocardia sp. NPDC050378]|uniref:hypothetical protein n=1 Tax=Nocardia sp. NPDC050378 TaxID=3155400 RepID=UPI0033DB5A16
MRKATEPDRVRLPDSAFGWLIARPVGLRASPDRTVARSFAEFCGLVDILVGLAVLTVP